MIEFYLNLSVKDKLTLIGILIAATTSLLSLIITFKSNKSTSYVNSVTTERIRSMSQLKLNVANYLSLLQQYVNRAEESIPYEQFYKASLHVEFQLNPQKKNEKLIIFRMHTIIKILQYASKNKKPIKVKDLIADLEYIGINKERIPTPYTNNTLLNSVYFLKYIKRVVGMEAELIEDDLKKHIKNEWEKIKVEV